MFRLSARGRLRAASAEIVTRLRVRGVEAGPGPDLASQSAEDEMLEVRRDAVPGFAQLRGAFLARHPGELFEPLLDGLIGDFGHG